MRLFLFFYEKQMSPDRFFFFFLTRGPQPIAARGSLTTSPSRHTEGVLKINIRYDEEK